MYLWRRMTDEQRQAALRERQANRRPWHGPAHIQSDTSLYLLTAACYEHAHIIGASPERMVEFEKELLEALHARCEQVFAWIVLPNHYHALVKTADVKAAIAEIGLVHGRTSYRWNGEDNQRKRHDWHRCAETAMKSERHYWATLNYVLNNAVRHGYVERWQDWPYSNAEDYLAAIGRERAEAIWRDFPILDFGADWDPPEL